MERDFIQKYDGGKAEVRPIFKAIYDDVVADLITEVRNAEGLIFDQDDRALRAIAVAAVRYAREFTRDRSSPVFEARRSMARERLLEALKGWQHERERKAAQYAAERQAALDAPRRRKRSDASRQGRARKT